MFISRLCVVANLIALLGCQATRPPARRPSQPRPSPAMSAEQMEGVQSILQRGSGTLTVRCYQPELDRRDEPFEARAIVKIQVQRDGRVGNVEFAESTLDPTFRDCIEHVIRSWEFPQLPDSAWFTYPLVFSADN